MILKNILGLAIKVPLCRAGETPGSLYAVVGRVYRFMHHSFAVLIWSWSQHTDLVLYMGGSDLEGLEHSMPLCLYFKNTKMQKRKLYKL